MKSTIIMLPNGISPIYVKTNTSYKFCFIACKEKDPIGNILWFTKFPYRSVA